MDGTDSQTVDVLLVEDDPGDALLAQEAFTDTHGTGMRCHVASDCQVAARFLWRQAEFAKAPRPRLILLDLNLGATHGLQILARVQKDNELRTIPSSCSHPHVTPPTPTPATPITPARTSSHPSSLKTSAAR
jgi:CheY-like chemotaxis protein